MLHVWLAPSDEDPAVHYWYQLQGNILPRRLCDGAMGALEATDCSGDVCLSCRGIYLTDLERGRQLFRLIDLSISEQHLTLQSHLNCDNFPLWSSTSNRDAPEVEDMPPGTTTMSGLRWFCETPDDKKEEVARKLRDGGGGSPLHQGLIRLFRNEHWPEGKDLSTLKKALPGFVENQKKPKDRETGRIIADKYIAYVEDISDPTNWIPLPCGWVNVGGLSVKVNPEVLMDTEGQQQRALKFWMREDPPEIESLWILHYLMEQVSKYSAYVVAVWDVRRGRLSDVRTPPGFEKKLEEQAQDLLDLWRQMFGDPDRLL